MQNRLANLSLVALVAAVVAVVVALAMLELPAQAGKQVQTRGDDGTISRGQGVTFDQVDFTFPKETERNSDWGEVVVDTEELSDSTGRSSGYLNVFTDAGWVVDNLFVDAENSRQAMKYFSLGLEKPEDVTRLSAHVVFSKNPKSSFKDGPRSNFPVGTTKWNAQGAGQEDVTEIPAAPPPKEDERAATAVSSANGVTSARANVKGPQHFVSDKENVQCAVNQCVPCAYANSLQFLENSTGIKVPNPNKPGLRGDNTLVGQLDEKMNRRAPSRTDGDGVWFVPMLQGKFDYLAENRLKNALSQKHQGRGYGQVVPPGDFQHMGITSKDRGATVRWKFIDNQVKKGEDVELVFSYDGGGGHAVRVVGSGITANDRWIKYAHDSVQSDDSAGLETPTVNVKDLDNDGTLNLGSVDQEIVFVHSESEAKDDKDD
jgi:hypothetical protein